VDKNYYFVLETHGSDEGPYVLSEIRRRIELGLLSRSVTLCRVGETDYVPATNTQPADTKPAVTKPAESQVSLEAVTASINTAATIVEPMKPAVERAPAKESAPAIASAAVHATPQQATALGSAPLFAHDPLDMTVETTPVPRFDPDLIDAPTSLDPVSGTMIDAASGVEDLAQTGPFDAIPTMMIETGPLQSFTGTLDNGVVGALPEKEAEAIGADASFCDSSHRPDRIVAAKLQGTQLILYPTDGNAYPETIELAKQAPKSSE
jgi:hypothetical protein